jgi:chitodextrinase
MKLARAMELRAIIEEAMSKEDDSVVLETPQLLPEWKAGIAYKTGKKIQYGGVVWKVLQDHTSQEGWEPGAAPSLFAEVLIPDPDVIPEWKQPDSTNPYMKGDKVTHNGTTWVCNIDNNVWEPGVYGWDPA